MSHITRPTALITGASTGIGLELAILFAKDSYNLVLVARGEAALESVAEKLRQEYSVQVTCIIQDLSELGAATSIYNLLHQKGITVDVLVNNAGFGTFGEFTEVKIADQLNMMQVNMNALVELTYLFLPAMRQKKNEKILNIASTAAFQAGPLMAVYFASKAFVLSFTEALSIEVNNDLVTVTALCPGPTKTQFSSRAHLESSRMFQGSLMSAAEVARVGYEALGSNKTLAIAGFSNALGAFATRLVPRRLAAKIVFRAQSNKPV